MLAELVPGWRDLRTPLIVGALWAALVWFWVGPHLATNERLLRLAHDYYLTRIPAYAGWTIAAFAAYLLGDLLVVKRSPLAWFSVPFRAWFDRLVDEHERQRDFWGDGSATGKRVPKTWDERLHMFIWMTPVLGDLLVRGEGGADKVIDGWLWDHYEAHIDQDRVPLLETDFSDTTPHFKNYISTMDLVTLRGTGPNVLVESSRDFRDLFKKERNAVEVRIQSKFPDVFNRSKRNQAEGELRLSIFWPLVFLTIFAATHLATWLLLFLVVPLLLWRNGNKRIRLASETTWGVLIAGDVTSPILDDMNAAWSRDNPLAEQRQS